MTGSGTESPLGRVEGVAKAVTHEVDRQRDDDDRKAWEGHEPPELEALALSVGDQLPERGVRRLDPEAEERERSLDQDRRGDDQRRVDDDRAERVREHVAEHDPRVART